MKTVQIIYKSVYGNEMIYPFNDAAKSLASLTGKKTFSERDLRHIKDLGFGLERVADNGVVIEVKA